MPLSRMEREAEAVVARWLRENDYKAVREAVNRAFRQCAPRQTRRWALIEWARSEYPNRLVEK